MVIIGVYLEYVTVIVLDELLIAYVLYFSMTPTIKSLLSLLTRDTIR